MHRRRHHPQQRRRVPCATEPARPPREEVAPPSGPYIDLSNPAEPKLVGDLPAEFQEFGRILLQFSAARRGKVQSYTYMLPPRATNDGARFPFERREAYTRRILTRLLQVEECHNCGRPVVVSRLDPT